MHDLKSELAFWGQCANTHEEEKKQFFYALLMGIRRSKSHNAFDAQGRSILDIGGGPTSMLLKTDNRGRGKIIDPLAWPAWVMDRYKAIGVEYQVMKAEDMNETGWDEVWLYNVLQHVNDPERVMFNIRRAAKVLRIFEWVGGHAYEGHPHVMSKENLDKWIGKEGRIFHLMYELEHGGLAYAGEFTL